MTPFQVLIILVFIILIVWWALRRSTSQSAKEAPTHHEPAEHAKPGEHEEHADALHAEVVEIEPLPASPEVLPEPEPTVMPQPVPEPEPVVMPQPVSEPEPVVLPQRVPEPVEVAAPEVEVKPDDLIIIEGIGPRISGVLKSHGVKTFAQLAAMQPAEIRAILSGVDERLARIADPTSWPEQAALAAKGDLEGLQKLQDSLKGGRL